MGATQAGQLCAPRDISPTRPVATPVHRIDFHHLILVALIVLVGLALRIGLALGAVAVGRDAAGKYLPLARAWQQGDLGAAPSAGLPPLYPMVSGLLARLVGDVETAARIVSIVGGMLLLLFVFLLAYRLAGRWTACVAMALAALHPFLCQYSADVGPDSLAAGLLAGLVYAVCAYLLTFSFGYMVLAAGAMAGLALVRPEGVAYAPLAVGVMLAWPVAGKACARRQAAGAGDAQGSDRAGRRRLWRRRVGHVGMLAVMLAGLCVPRLISVYRQTGVLALDTRQRTWTARIVTALRTGQPAYGQWRIWSRGGWAAAGDTAGAVVTGFGPAVLLFGIYGLVASRRLPRRRVALVVAVFVAYSVLLVLVGNRISRRYLLAPAALWQVWGAIGLVWMAARVRARRRGPWSARWRAMPVTAGLVIACLQGPWVPTRLYREFLADRRMGEWMAANLPAGTRVLAMESVPLWYGQAAKVIPPTFKPSRLTPAKLAIMAGDGKADYILVDTRGGVWCPDVWGRLQKGEWPYGRIVHRQSERRHTLYLLEVTGLEQARRDAAPRQRQKAVRAPAAPSTGPTVRHPKGKRLAVEAKAAATRAAALSSQPAASQAGR